MQAKKIIGIARNELAATTVQVWNDPADHLVLAKLVSPTDTPPFVEPPVRSRVTTSFDEPYDYGFPLRRFAFACAALLVLILAVWTTSRREFADTTLGLDEANSIQGGTIAPSLGDESIHTPPPTLADAEQRAAMLTPQVANPAVHEVEYIVAPRNELATISVYAFAVQRVEAVVDVPSVPQKLPTTPGDDPAQKSPTQVADASTAVPPVPASVKFDLPPKFAEAPAVCEDGDCGATRDLGTQVQWAETVNDAAELANEHNKLVYLIHLSGNFEIPEFT